MVLHGRWGKCFKLVLATAARFTTPVGCQDRPAPQPPLRRSRDEGCKGSPHQSMPAEDPVDHYVVGRAQRAQRDQRAVDHRVSASAPMGFANDRLRHLLTKGGLAPSDVDVTEGAVLMPIQHFRCGAYNGTRRVSPRRECGERGNSGQHVWERQVGEGPGGDGHTISTTAAWPGAEARASARAVTSGAGILGARGYGRRGGRS
jgi:hypothetical protein